MNSDTRGAGEFQQARSAGGTELRFRLPGAGPAYLQGALQNPAFGEEHLAPILSNPALPAMLIQQIAGNSFEPVGNPMARGHSFCHFQDCRKINSPHAHVRVLLRQCNSPNPASCPEIQHARRRVQIRNPQVSSQILCR